MPAILVGFCKKKKLKKIGQQRGAVKDARIWSQKASNFGWVLLKKKAENWTTARRGERCADLEAKASTFCWILFEKKEENWATTWRGERCAYLEPKGQQFSLGFVKKKAEENWATARRGERCACLEPKGQQFLLGFVKKKKLKKIGQQRGAV